MWFELSKGWIGLEPSELMIRPVNRLVSHDQNGSQIFFLFFKNFFPSKWRFSLYVSSPNLAPFPPCMSPTTPCRSNWRLQSHCLCTSTRNPLDFKSSMWILQFIYFFPFLIQTIPIFSPHNRPLFSIKYIITCIPCYYLIYEMNRNWNKFIFKIKI